MTKATKTAADPSGGHDIKGKPENFDSFALTVCFCLPHPLRTQAHRQGNKVQFTNSNRQEK
ncbi:hypothetical protein D082_09880 [Synechocystis sp. PCC 6714]|nr:hypothetical protein D082_09880 [Synechocystis sp. PCC 6714]